VPPRKAPAGRYVTFHESRAMAGPDDRELIERFRRGDGSGFEALVARYVRLAGAIAYGVVGEYAAASDVVQEAWLRVHQGLGDLREPEKFRAWLYGIVRSTALDWLRKNKRRPMPLSAIKGREDLLSGPGAAPAEMAEREERSALVLREVQALPESYREIVVLKYIEERSYGEISEILGVSIETIESRLFRARKLLRTRLAALLERPARGED